MRTIYLDGNFKCHAGTAEGLVPVETDVFDGKCDTYIEGYRFVPAGFIWIREDGEEFPGEMFAPWRDYPILAEAQRDFELEQMRAELEDAKAALALLGVTEEGATNG